MSGQYTSYWNAFLLYNLIWSVWNWLLLPLSLKTRSHFRFKTTFPSWPSYCTNACVIGDEHTEIHYRTDANRQTSTERQTRQMDRLADRETNRLDKYTDRETDIQREQTKVAMDSVLSIGSDQDKS